ncbi:MAG: hypothetical protein HDT14_11985 [Oscillibacter sp.]|nr:hypothetical protein [Oscillibacter sp.]
MKISTKRRLLSLLLALALTLSMAPAALSANNPGSNDEEGEKAEENNPGSGEGGHTGSGDEAPGEEQSPDTVTKINLGGNGISQMEVVEAGKEYTLILEPNSTRQGSVQLTVDLEPASALNESRHVVWASSDSSVVSTEEQSDSQRPGQGHIGIITGEKPGTADVTITAGDLVCTIHVEVSGIKLSSQLEEEGLRLSENELKVLRLGTDYFLFGNAKNAEMSAREINSKTIVFIPAIISNASVSVEGRREGTGTLRLSANYGGIVSEKDIPLTVTADEGEIDWTEAVSPSRPLQFSALESLMNLKCQEMTRSNLVSIIDLSVSPSQGIIYHGYKSPDDAGSGAGSGITYYASGAVRGPYIRDLVFVPSESFRGEKATIEFTGQATDSTGANRTFKCRINVTLADAKTEDVLLTTRSDVPLKLKAEDFIKVCQAQTGASLSYVIFTQPPASQGTLYRDYKNAMDYASRVNASEKYDRKGLDDVSFVPAQSFVGTVTISYEGYSTTGGKYIGRLVIQVRQSMNAAITYTDDGAGEVSFSRWDFEDFCVNVGGRALSGVSFTPPPVSQGTLYYGWNGVRGSAVGAGVAYSPAQIDRLTFVAANSFEGMVRIPFSGTDRDGVEFSGTVEILIQSFGSGDISYVCAPGESVKLELSDFAGFCQSLTGQRLHYINFPTLPDFHQGALYHNRTSGGGMGTRVTTSTRYYNSATPYIANLSFWAAETFRGSLEIPFTGCAVSGETFSGLLVISSGAGAGSGSIDSITYHTSGQDPARFVGQDFDTVCRQATNEALSYIRLELPSSGQGILYCGYHSGTNPTALSRGQDLYLNGENRIDWVTFAPGRGFAGTVSLSYLGTSITGRTFTGTVEITVYAASSQGGLVRYETTGAPVHLDVYRIQEASGGVPTSLRFTGMPTEDQGKLYFGYVGPTQYSWQGNTSTEYHLYSEPAVSNLTFVPKAGFYGEVNIPYTAVKDGVTSYSGTIRILVTQPQVSAHFDDLADCSAQTRSAVDYLYAQGVVNGVGERRYSPDASIRRGDFCLMLARAFQFSAGSTVTGFMDVPSDAYYANAVNQMYALGVVNGVGDKRFQPSAAISRQDAALMVQRALKQAGINVPDGSADDLAAYEDRDQVSGYAQGAVSGLVRLGLLPTDHGSISPQADLTRADMALLLHRAMTQ